MYSYECLYRYSQIWKNIETVLVRIRSQEYIYTSNYLHTSSLRVVSRSNKHSSYPPRGIKTSHNSTLRPSFLIILMMIMMMVIMMIMMLIILMMMMMVMVMMRVMLLMIMMIMMMMMMIIMMMMMMMIIMMIVMIMVMMIIFIQKLQKKNVKKSTLHMDQPKNRKYKLKTKIE
jgi:MFS family permease